MTARNTSASNSFHLPLAPFSLSYFWQLHDLLLSLQPSEGKGMEKKKQYIAYLLFLVSILMLAVPVVPHHHHGSEAICLKNDLHTGCGETNHHHHPSQLLPRQGLPHPPVRPAHAAGGAPGSPASPCPATGRPQSACQPVVSLHRFLFNCFIFSLYRIAARCIHHPCLGIKGSSQPSCLSVAVCARTLQSGCSLRTCTFATGNHIY